jgi:uncharacterized OB-fold protein
MPRSQAPTPGFDDRIFWEGVAQDRLMLTYCRNCGRLQHPPSPMCPACGSLEWEGKAASGRGRVHSWIVSHHPTDPDDAALIVALIELDEGVRLVSNLHQVAVADARNDMPVEVVFVEVDGVRLPQFRAV